jgi:hypothetical protein
MVDFSKQQFVLARLADYCDYRTRIRASVRDPLLYMWEKLKELDEPLQSLKQEIFEEAAAAFFWRVRRKEIDDESTADFKQILDAYLSPGDFADAMFHLGDTNALSSDDRRFQNAVHFFRELKVYRLLEEEDKPEDARRPDWERIVSDIRTRLAFDLLETAVERKPMNSRRLRFILRRLRRETSEYCVVLHFPKHAKDTFTPFILPRIEALIAANRRVLQLIRGGA